MHNHNHDLTRSLEGHRFFGRALQALEHHPYKEEMNFLHASVIVRGGKILSIGVNRPKQNSFVWRFAHYEHATIHSEVDAILQVRNKIDLRGCKIYVARLSKRYGGATISKPCDWCEETLRKYGIKRVYYTNEFGGFDIMNLNRWS